MDTFSASEMCDASEATDTGADLPAVPSSKTKAKASKPASTTTTKAKGKRTIPVTSDDDNDTTAAANDAEAAVSKAADAIASEVSSAKTKSKDEDAEDKGSKRKRGGGEDKTKTEKKRKTRAEKEEAAAAAAEEEDDEDKASIPKKKKSKTQQTKEKEHAPKSKAKSKAKAKAEEGEEEKEEDGEGADPDATDDDDDDDGDESGADGEEETAEPKRHKAAEVDTAKEEGEADAMKTASSKDIPANAPLIREPFNDAEKAYRAQLFKFYYANFKEGDRISAVEDEVVFLRNTGEIVMVTKRGVFPFGPLMSKELTKDRYAKLLKSGNATEDKVHMADLQRGGVFVPELNGRHLMHGVVLKYVGEEKLSVNKILNDSYKEANRYQAHAAYLRFKHIMDETRALVCAKPDAKSWTLKDGSEMTHARIKETEAKIEDRRQKMQPCADENEPNQWDAWCEAHHLVKEPFSKTFVDKKTGDSSTVTLTDYLGQPVWNEVSFISCMVFWTDSKNKLMSARYYYRIKPKEAETLHEDALRQFTTKITIKDTKGKDVEKTVTLLTETGNAEQAWSTANRHPLGSDVRRKYGIPLNEWAACPYRFVPELLLAQRCEKKIREKGDPRRAKFGYSLDPNNAGYLLAPPVAAASKTAASASAPASKEAADKTKSKAKGKGKETEKAKVAKDKTKEKASKAEAVAPEEQKKKKTVAAAASNDTVTITPQHLESSLADLKRHITSQLSAFFEDVIRPSLALARSSASVPAAPPPSPDVKPSPPPPPRPLLPPPSLPLQPRTASGGDNPVAKAAAAILDEVCSKPKEGEAEKGVPVVVARLDDKKDLTATMTDLLSDVKAVLPAAARAVSADFLKHNSDVMGLDMNKFKEEVKVERPVNKTKTKEKKPQQQPSSDHDDEAAASVPRSNGVHSAVETKKDQPEPSPDQSPPVTPAAVAPVPVAASKPVSAPVTAAASAPDPFDEMA